MPQLNLFDRPAKALARKNDPITSHAAAAKAAPKLGGIRAAVLECVVESPGLTAAELADKYNYRDIRTVNRRLPELRLMGLVSSRNERECQITGSKCMTWWPVNQGGSHEREGVRSEVEGGSDQGVAFGRQDGGGGCRAD